MVSGDVLVLAQKIVSKAQGRFVDLDQVSASARALELAKVVGKDPRVIELIVDESSDGLWARRDVLVVVTRLGFVIENGGVRTLSHADLRGKPDLFGRPLRITQVGLADELAAAASLLMGQADEGTPIVLVRGLSYVPAESRAAELVRPKELDLFR